MIGLRAPGPGLAMRSKALARRTGRATIATSVIGSFVCRNRSHSRLTTLDHATGCSSKNVISRIHSGCALGGWPHGSAYPPRRHATLDAPFQERPGCERRHPAAGAPLRQAIWMVPRRTCSSSRPAVGRQPEHHETIGLVDVNMQFSGRWSWLGRWVAVVVVVQEAGDLLLLPRPRLQHVTYRAGGVEQL